MEERANGQRFERIDDVISVAEIEAISKGYQRVAGYDKETVAGR